MRGTQGLPDDPVLDFLIRYTEYHFAGEEELMQQYGYPGLGAHKQKHEELIRDVLAFLTDAAHAKRAIIEDDIKLPRELRAQLSRLDKLHRVKEDLERQRLELANSLREQDFSLGDVGDLLGVSKQRVAQMLGKGG